MLALVGPSGSGKSTLVALLAGLMRPSAIAEGPVEPVGPDDPVAGIDAERVRWLLRDVFTAAGGTHDDWDTYDAVMARERRTAVLVTPRRLYS